MRDYVILCTVLLVTYVSEVAALRCYSCDDFETSEDCMNFTECSNGEICYARADGLSNGKVRYTVGCTLGQSAVREDFTFCTDICSENLCNLNKCNIPVSPMGKPERSPRCLSCELVDSPSTCLNLVQCAGDEMCYVREVTVYGLQKFRLGCINKQHCFIGQSATVSPLQIIGRRAVSRSANSSSVCSVCCENDHCNMLVCQAVIGPSHPLHLLDDNDTCVDKNVDACAVFGTLNSDACKTIPKVDLLCPRSCGICGHFGWSQWSNWSGCSQTCDEGTSHRSRTCLYQTSIARAHTCEGLENESKSCNEEICPTEGSWSAWGSWGICTRSCLNGTRIRSRDCSSVSEHQGSVFCYGDHIDTEFCNQQACPPQTPCPDNWFAYHLSCYYFGNNRMSFAAAQTFCHSKNATQVHIEFSGENNFLIDHIKKYSNPSDGWWVGMTDTDVEGRWMWTDTNQRVNFTNWASGEPNNSGSEDCGEILPSNTFKWNDIDCTNSKRAICEINTAHRLLKLNY